MKYFMVIATLMFLSGCTLTNQPTQEDYTNYLNMSKEEHKKLIDIKDDSLEQSASFNTRSSFQEKFGLLDIVWSDYYLRGFVDKRTNKQTIQLYARLKHLNKQWVFPNYINYGSPLQSTPLIRLGSNVDCKNSDVLNSCTYIEEVAAQIDNNEINRIRNKIKLDSHNNTGLSTSSGWAFKIKTKSGIDYVNFIAPNEFAALFEVMDDYYKKIRR